MTKKIQIFKAEEDFLVFKTPIDFKFTNQLVVKFYKDNRYNVVGVDGVYGVVVEHKLVNFHQSSRIVSGHTYLTFWTSLKKILSESNGTRDLFLEWLEENYKVELLVYTIIGEE